jgi:catechol 2,3-dioxygenase
MSATRTLATLPAATGLGPVELTVRDLDRAVAFYGDVIGLATRRDDGSGAALGAGDTDVLALAEDPQARPAGRHSGLYHVALLFPSRLELARAAVRLATTRTPIQGASDHGTHEAIYLADADGNGLELAADRPRERWPDLRYLSGPAPLDLDGLLGLVADEPPVARAGDGLRVGHVHLHVGDLEAAARFYRDVIGFDLVTRLPTAAFLSAGGYHHHVAVNTWRGTGIPDVPEGTVGMRHFTLRVPADGRVALLARLDAAGVAHTGGLVRDPAGNALRIEGA